MYRGDGSFIRTMDDSTIYWGASAPWDAYVADDDYVYVGDRSSRLVYCFKPDGSASLTGNLVLSDHQWENQADIDVLASTGRVRLTYYYSDEYQ